MIKKDLWKKAFIMFHLCSRVEVHNGKEGIAADGWNRKSCFITQEDERAKAMWGEATNPPSSP